MDFNQEKQTEVKVKQMDEPVSEKQDIQNLPQDAKTASESAREEKLSLLIAQNVK